MTFVAWIFLLGAGAVVGPILVHLLAKPRYKRVPFTMMRFLQKGQFQTQNRRRLRNLLILLLRCAIIILIAMLFARPQWLTQVAGDDTNRIYYLGLDNSISMAYKDGGQTYFDKMIDSAMEYIRNTEVNGSFNICALASGDWCKQVTREQALMYVKRLKICHASAQVKDFLSDIRRTLDKADDNDKISALVVSDFTPKTLRQFVDYEQQISVANIKYKMIASAKVIDNAAITDAAADNFSAGKLSINVSITNYSPTAQKRTLTAKAIGGSKTSMDIVVNADQQKNHVIKLDVDAGDTELLLPVELSLSSGDRLDADDKYYVVVSLPKHRNVNILLLGKSDKEMFLLKTVIETISSTASNETIDIRESLFNKFDSSALTWPDVVICSSMSRELAKAAQPVKTFVSNGGKVIFFTSPESDKKAAEKLWQQEVLAALPGKYVSQRTYIKPEPSDAKLTTTEEDDSIVKSLRNYQMDNIIVKGFYECTPADEGICKWQFENGYGLIYSKPLGNGTSVLINTSTDDSMASLMKSSASVAFCRYLLGAGKDITEHSFTCEEQVTLPAIAMEIKYARTDTPIWVKTCSGMKTRAAVVDSFIVPPISDGTGWVKTLTKPTRYAGVNLTDGETDMTKPSRHVIANLMGQIFVPKVKHTLTATSITVGQSYKPLWRTFAWIIIALIIVEAAVVNRMKR